MTDEELAGPRVIDECTEREDGGWDVTLVPCGHKSIHVVQPVNMGQVGCAQCIQLLVERRKKAV